MLKFAQECRQSVKNSLDPNQARCFVVPDQGQICLQRVSTDDGIRQNVFEIEYTERVMCCSIC